MKEEDLERREAVNGLWAIGDDLERVTNLVQTIFSDHVRQALTSYVEGDGRVFEAGFLGLEYMKAAPGETRTWQAEFVIDTEDHEGRRFYAELKRPLAEILDEALEMRDLDDLEVLHEILAAALRNTSQAIADRRDEINRRG